MPGSVNGVSLDAHRVVLDLHGPRAQRGIDLDALESFIEHFRRALRDFDLESRREMVGRGGHPGSRSAAAAGFRLVAFEVGSAVVTLEPSSTPTGADQEELPLSEEQHLASQVLERLLDAVEESRVTTAVGESLSNACRAIGKGASFGVRMGGRPNRRVVVSEQGVSQPREAELDGTEPHWLTVRGRLHFIETEATGRRVGVRAQDGVDWSCTYEDVLEPKVKTLIDSLVQISGEGRRITPGTGRLIAATIEPLAAHEQSELFTSEPVSLEDLQAAQGVKTPQGLAALTGPEWVDDDAARRFLAATLSDDGAESGA